MASMSAVKPLLHWLLKAGLPDSYPNLTELSRLRIINLCTVLCGIITIPFIFKYKSMGVTIVAWGISHAENRQLEPQIFTVKEMIDALVCYLSPAAAGHNLILTSTISEELTLRLVRTQ